jgi:anti-anti-sigma factor
MDDQSMKSVEYERINDIVILYLDGDFSSCRIMNFETVLEEIMQNHTITIAVDCSNLYILDPTTISQIAKYMKKAVSKNIELLFFNVNPEVQLTFELMKLDGLFSLISREKFEREYIRNNIIN